jgi:hypothetical protein
MTRRDAATATWQDLTAALRRMTDEDFAALNPTSLTPVEAAVRVRPRSGQG